jgi:cytochrome c oxidase subunit 1
LWDLKHGAKRPEAAAPEKPASEHIHVPPPSYWPLVLALGIVLSISGFIYGPILTAVGLVIFVIGFAGWIAQPV